MLASRLTSAIEGVLPVPAPTRASGHPDNASRNVGRARSCSLPFPLSCRRSCGIVPHHFVQGLVLAMIVPPITASIAPSMC